jgi:predicted transcriptional regulator
MIQVALPDEVVDKLQAVADRDGTALADVLAEAVEQYVARTESAIEKIDEAEVPDWKVQWEEHKRRIEAEQRIYEATHHELVQEFLGKHIAMYEGKLIDFDEDGVALHQRIRLRYGNAPVLVTPVFNTPRQVIRLRGPRLAKRVPDDTTTVSN